MRELSKDYHFDRKFQPNVTGNIPHMEHLWENFGAWSSRQALENAAWMPPYRSYRNDQTCIQRWKKGVFLGDGGGKNLSAGATLKLFGDDTYIHPGKLTWHLKIRCPKRKGSSSNHPFSGANMLVSGSVGHRNWYYVYTPEIWQFAPEKERILRGKESSNHHCSGGYLKCSRAV